MRLHQAKRRLPPSEVVSPARELSPRSLSRKRRFEQLEAEGVAEAQRQYNGGLDSKRKKALSRPEVVRNEPAISPPRPVAAGRFELFEALSEVKREGGSGYGTRPYDYDVQIHRDRSAIKAASVVKDLLRAHRDARLAALASSGVRSNTTQERMTVPHDENLSGLASRRKPTFSMSRELGFNYEIDSVTSTATSMEKACYQGPLVTSTPWGCFLCHSYGKSEFEIDENCSIEWDARSNWTETSNGRPPSSVILKHLGQLSMEMRLHHEITAYSTWCEPTAGEIRKRLEILAKVHFVAQSLWPNCEIIPFGSFSTGLTLPAGDVDICIMNVPGRFPADSVNQLVRALRRCRFARQLTAITKARIPIAKFVDDASAIQVDISINQESAMETSDLIRETLHKWPCMRPIILVLKHMLSQLDLGATYKGGIGSYMLFTMVLSYFQFEVSSRKGSLKGMNLGELLIGFLRRYTDWNYLYDAIDVRGKGRVFAKDDLSTRQELDTLMCIASPLEPQTDIGKNSYKIEDCVDRFRQRLQRLESVREAERKTTDPHALRRLRESSLLSAVLSMDERIFRRRIMPRSHPDISDFSIYSLRPSLVIPIRIYEETYKRMERCLELLNGCRRPLADLLPTSRKRARSEVDIRPRSRLRQSSTPASEVRAVFVADDTSSATPGKIDDEDEEGVCSEIEEISATRSPPRIVAISDDDDEQSLIMISPTRRVVNHLVSTSTSKLSIPPWDVVD